MLNDVFVSCVQVNISALMCALWRMGTASACSWCCYEITIIWAHSSSWHEVLTGFRVSEWHSMSGHLAWRLSPPCRKGVATSQHCCAMLTAVRRLAQAFAIGIVLRPIRCRPRSAPCCMTRYAEVPWTEACVFCCCMMLSNAWTLCCAAAWVQGFVAPPSPDEIRRKEAEERARRDAEHAAELERVRQVRRHCRPQMQCCFKAVYLWYSASLTDTAATLYPRSLPTGMS